VSQLSTRERAFALAAVNTLGPIGAARYCARRSPLLSAHAAALADATVRAREVDALDRPVPEGLAHVHASWYVPPAPARRPDALAHLQRIAYGHLVAMTAPLPSEEFARVEQLSPPALERLLVTLGRGRVATAFVGAPRSGVAQLCARLGEPAASELVAELRARRASPPSPDEIKAAQHAVYGSERRPDGARGFSEGDRGRNLFLRVGAGMAAAALAGEGDRLQRAAQRLPRGVGQLLLDAAAARSGELERRVARAQLAIALGGGL
jgi:hypothetical protein